MADFVTSCFYITEHEVYNKDKTVVWRYETISALSFDMFGEDHVFFIFYIPIPSFVKKLD